MKTKLKLHLLLLTLLSLTGFAHAQSTAFTYNGRLNNNGAPVNGAYDMRFTLYDVNVAGNVVVGPLPISPVDVANGLFTVRVDFGANVFTGPARWLGIEVRPVGDANYRTLTPRQEVTSSPYAIRAQTAGSVPNGTVTANQLSSGGILPTMGQFLSYDGEKFLWRNPGVAVGDVWSRNGAGDAYYNGAKVGIGTSEPLAPLEVIGPVRSTRISGLPQYIQLNGGDSGSIKLTAQSNLDAEKNLFIENLSGQATSGPNNNMQFVLGTTAARSTKMTIRGNGAVGIGTVSPRSLLHMYEPVGSVSHRIETGGNTNAWTRVDFANANGQWDIGTSRGFNEDQFYFFREGSTTGNAFAIQPNGDAYVQGTMSCKVLTIRGGADVAEPFVMPEAIAKGSVVVIDGAHPGQLKLSAEAYDTRVAGIVSGANGISPGIALHQEGMVEGGQNVALSGRVYVQADAAFGAIKPGDLLTTSDTPGHAMKVTEHSKAQGAILGKAMSGLNEGKGMVLVLVTLQ
jgi:hypothetical protein